jgi:hypothetical protein
MTLYISEYSQMPITDNAVGKNWAMTPPLVEQTVAIGGSSTASNAFNVNTRFVRLSVDSTTACSIAFGASPVATTSNARMAASTTEYFGVQGGARVAVIENT